MGTGSKRTGAWRYAHERGTRHGRSGRVRSGANLLLQSTLQGKNAVVLLAQPVSRALGRMSLRLRLLPRCLPLRLQSRKLRAARLELGLGIGARGALDVELVRRALVLLRQVAHLCAQLCRHL